MGWGVVIILIFSALLALIVYLYQEHVDHLNHTIEMLRVNKNILGEELDNYKELVEDLDGYYDKWIETVNELSEAKNHIFELEQENGYLQKEKEGCEWEIENLQMQNDDLYRELEEYR